MKPRLVSLLFIFIFALEFFPSIQPYPVKAQASGVDTISFFQIRQTDIQLFGPYDVELLSFGLPADWRLTGASELTLEINVSLSTLSGTAIGDQIAGTGGTLRVEYNREIIGSFPLTQNGDVSQRILIPLELMKSVREDNKQEIVFELDSGFSCLINQQMTVTIRTSSNFIFQHEEILPDVSLAKFPFPIYQASVYPDKALIVVPDEPTADELQSAMIVSGGLGKLTNMRLAIDLTTAGKLSPEQMAAENLIFVGKASSFPGLDQLQFPLPFVGGKAQSVDVDDGIVQMINSPWNSGRVILLVSGNSDEGVLKASQAVSTGTLRSNTSSNLSIIQNIQAGTQVSQSNDMTLSDLGYETSLFERRGVDSATFLFFVPPGMTLGPDAYFELFFGNSALLDYTRSGLVVQINGHPVGSARFSEVTAAETTNRLQIKIPPSIVISGNNTLEVISNLQAVDNCSAPNLRGLWATIWSDSRLHLSLVPALSETIRVLSLSEYPAPFVFDPSLSTTAFVLHQGDLESWRSAAQVAFYLSERANGSIVSLETYYANEVPESARLGKHFIVMGIARELEIINELNAFLPAPFELETGLAVEKNMQVTFRIPVDSPVGYIELLSSPWNENNIIVVAVGNIRQGASWAISALFSSPLRSNLAGNFAVINDQKITATDTRVSLPQQNTETSDLENVNVVPPDVNTASPVAIKRPNWILPVIIIASVLVVLILIGVLYKAVGNSGHRNKIVPKVDTNGDGL